MESDSNGDWLPDGWVRAMYIEPDTGSSAWADMTDDFNVVHGGHCATEPDVYGQGPFAHPSDRAGRPVPSIRSNDA